MKKVYGYIRVSTTKQGEGVSLIEQKEAILRHASHQNLNIIKWFEEKETAAKQGRPLFNEMMKLVTKKNADGIIMHKIDRSARNLKDWADLGTLIDKGVEVHFAHETLDMQARGGRLSADIQAVIAADYIRNLRDETKKGLYGRIRQGIYPFQAPVGYVNNGSGKLKTFHPIQGPLVKMAFELYASEKYNLRELCYHMDKLGLRNTFGKKVCITSLSIILSNPFYAGIIKVKGERFRGIHEPLISPELFQKVKDIMVKKTNRKTVKHDFKFSRSIKCKFCGYSLIGENQKGHIYYRCQTKECPTKGVRESMLDNYMHKVFGTMSLVPEEVRILNELLEETKADWTEKQVQLLTVIGLQKRQSEEKLERLTDCYVEGGIDKDVFERRKDAILMELKTREFSELETERKKESLLVKVERYIGISKDIVKTYELANNAEQRKLLKITTSNFDLDGKKLVISMRSPFLELSERWKFSECCLERGIPRKMRGILAYSSENTSPILVEPLSRDGLKSLLDLLLESISQIPDDIETPVYDN